MGKIAGGCKMTMTDAVNYEQEIIRLKDENRLLKKQNQGLTEAAANLSKSFEELCKAYMASRTMR